MDVSQVNWAYVGLGVFGVLSLAWIARLRRQRPGLAAIVVSVALLITAGLNAAAPWRGVLDPHYVGYGFGLLSAKGGWMVTAIAGTVFVLAAAGAFAALEKGRGAAMLTGLASLAFAVVIGLPWSRDAFANPAAKQDPVRRVPDHPRRDRHLASLLHPDPAIHCRRRLGRLAQLAALATDARERGASQATGFR
jgi:hypothetical protein